MASAELEKRKVSANMTINIDGSTLVTLIRDKDAVHIGFEERDPSCRENMIYSIPREKALFNHFAEVIVKPEKIPYLLATIFMYCSPAEIVKAMQIYGKNYSV